MGAIYKNSIKYSGGGGSAANERELTQAEYDLLTPEEKMNGTNYYITDGEGGGGSGGGGGVPTPTTADIGKVLTVNDNVNVAWGEASGGGADLFTVNFLDHAYAGPTPPVHSKDKTFAEIKQAIDEEKTVIGIHTSIFPTGQTTEGQTVTVYVAHQLPYTGSGQKVITFTAPISLKNTAQSAYCDTNQVIMYTLEVKEDETFTITNGAGYLISPYYSAIGKFLKYSSLGTFDFADVSGLSTTDPTGTGHLQLGNYCYADGENAVALGDSSYSSSTCSFAMGYRTTSSNLASMAVGVDAIAEGDRSVAFSATAKGFDSIAGASGYTTTSAYHGVALGSSSTSDGSDAIALGHLCYAKGMGSIAEGWGSTATADNSHAEGRVSEATAMAAHAEGRSTASGMYSHAGGYYGRATTSYAFAHGNHTTANQECQTVFGKYNSTSSNALFIIGNGTNSTTLSNAFEVHNDGSIKFTYNGTQYDLATVLHNGGLI